MKMQKLNIFIFLLFVIPLYGKIELNIIKVSGENIVADKGNNAGIEEGTEAYIVRKYSFANTIIGRAKILLVRGNKCAGKIIKLDDGKHIETDRDVLQPLLDQDYTNTEKYGRKDREVYSIGILGQAPKGLIGIYGTFGRVYIEAKTNGAKDWQHNDYYDILSEEVARDFFKDSKWGTEYTWVCADVAFYYSISRKDGLYIGAGICKEKEYIGYSDRTHILANDGKYLIAGEEKNKVNYIIGATFGKEHGFYQIMFGYNHVPQGLTFGLALVI